MRKILAIGCGVVYLAFGLVAGAAHVHESADHHRESRGLHIDHPHLGEATGHGHRSDHEHHLDHHRAGHGSTDHAGANADPRHTGHHDGDALYLTADALRSFERPAVGMPATVAVGGKVDACTASSYRDEETQDPTGGPPGRGPTRPRAPPA